VKLKDVPESPPEATVPVTQTELDNIVAEMRVEITFRPESDKKVFTTFSELAELFKSEMNFWNENQRGTELVSVLTAFQEVNQELVEAARGDATYARNHIAQAVEKERQKNVLTIYSRTGVAKFLADVAQKYDREVTNGAFSFITRNFGPNFINRMANPSFFSGMIRAFVFVNPNAFEGPLAANQAAFETLRNEMYSYEQQATKSFGALRDSIEAWRTQGELQIKELLDSKRAELDTQRTDMQNTSGTWRKSSDDSLTSWEGKMQGLHDTYSEKLKLEAPTKYWSDLEKAYLKTGRLWTGWRLW